MIVDELADLMMIAPTGCGRRGGADHPAGPGRPASTWCSPPSVRRVDVVTGLIKANMPSRHALTTASVTDSRVILDKPGAEKLTGKGDALYLPMGESVPQRIQDALITQDETKAIVAHWERQGPGDTVPDLLAETAAASPGAAAASTWIDDDLDDLIRAAELVVSTQFGSTSMLQRKMRVGFAKAGRLMDLLECRGIVGPSEGSKARDVLRFRTTCPMCWHRCAVPRWGWREMSAIPDGVFVTPPRPQMRLWVCGECGREEWSELFNPQCCGTYMNLSH